MILKLFSNKIIGFVFNELCDHEYTIIKISKYYVLLCYHENKISNFFTFYYNFLILIILFYSIVYKIFRHDF